MTTSDIQIQGPAWDNTTEYAGFDAPGYKADEVAFDRIHAEIKAGITKVREPMAEMLKTGKAQPDAILAMQKISDLRTEAVILGANLGSFASLESSIDSKYEKAEKENARSSERFSDLESSYMPLGLFLIRASNEIFEQYLTGEKTKFERFDLEQKRSIEAWSLSEQEEVLLNEFRQNGPTAWGRLYDQVSGTLVVKTENYGEVGLAKASSLTRSADEKERRQMWQGIQSAWKPYSESIAGVLNSLAGWRLTEYKKRSSKKPMGILSMPLVESRIEEATLNAMMTAVEQKKDLVARGLKLMANRLGKTKLDPWDLAAPVPKKTSARGIEFADGITMIKKTFAGMDPAMGEFIQTMVDNKWIDGRVLANKRNGAFCSGFWKSRTPRVFQTYTGSLQDVSTLAHELGHAFHSWIMRDMPIAETGYPMTLAETASIFAETALADEMAKTGNDEMKLDIAWADVADVVGLLGNIPARFEFEKNFYGARKNGLVSPKELSALTKAAWEKYYGDALTQVEEQFWMTKLHFSIAEVSFYNYPYTFGYLFSLSVYSRREQWGSEFYSKYCALLRDTGRMTAEALVQKHFGEDITKPEFWLKSLEICEEKIVRFEKL